MSQSKTITYEYENDEHEYDSHTGERIEYWKHIKGYPRYMVSTFGQVKNLDRGILMGQHYDKGGYLRTSLREGKTRKNFIIHRLVAAAFISGFDIDSKMTINHKNFNKDDNCAWNLEIMSRSKNSSNRRKAGKTSKYLGVSWDKDENKWKSAIYNGVKKKNLGRFVDEKQAARVRDQYAIDNDLDLQLNDISDSEEE